jgi:ribosomal protein L22
MKRAIPMRGEIPHRHGMMSGRYPIKASKLYIGLLKGLKANAMANDLELEKLKIFAVPNVASRPYKRFGQGRFKRTHVTIKLVPRINKEKKK